MYWPNLQSVNSDCSFGLGLQTTCNLSTALCTIVHCASRGKKHAGKEEKRGVLGLQAPKLKNMLRPGFRTLSALHINSSQCCRVTQCCAKTVCEPPLAAHSCITDCHGRLFSSFVVWLTDVFISTDRPIV